MIIEAFFIMYNEAEILPMVIKHYQKFCDKITFFDNYSTDGSDKIALSMGCVVDKFDTSGTISDEAYLRIKNNCWKKSDADFVIVADCDEVLLQKPFDLNCTIVKTWGWNVYSNDMPKNDLLEITNGYHFVNYSKSIMFSPKHILEINYEPGAHHCNPIGNIKYSDKTTPLLHYKQIGGVERLINRNKLLAKRLSMKNRKMGWGIHYLDSESVIRREWDERMKISRPLL